MIKIYRWGLKGVMSVMDQTVFSAANFILSILLARWLMPSHYGAYSIAFAIYQFAYQAHNAIIIEPMNVLGSTYMHHRRADYFRDQIKLHFVVSFFAGLIICVIGLTMLMVNQVLGEIIIIMGVGLSFILFPLLMRRGFYLFQKPEFALLGSGLYAILLVGQLWIFKISIDISVNLAFPIMAFAGLVSGFFLIKQIPPAEIPPTVPVAATWSSNWGYGKWLFVSSLLIALAAQAQTFVIGTFLGLADAGAFRALQNFVQPVILIFASISALMLPSMSYDFGKGNIANLKRKGMYLFVVLFVVSVSYYLFLSIYASNLESIIYDNNFSSYVYLIPVWGLVPIAGVLTYVFYFLLQSIQRPIAIFIGSCIWSVSSTVFSIIFSIKWGIAGATASVVIGYLSSGIAFAILYWYHISVKNKQRYV